MTKFSKLQNSIYVFYYVLILYNEQCSYYNVIIIISYIYNIEVLVVHTIKPSLRQLSITLVLFSMVLKQNLENEKIFKDIKSHFYY